MINKIIPNGTTGTFVLVAPVAGKSVYIHSFAIEGLT